MSTCPVCDNHTFDAFGKRENARCTKCGALERGRLAWLILKRLDVLKPGVRFLNFAPEPFMLFYGSQVIGDGYVACDYDPALYEKWGKPVRRVDICNDIAGMKPGEYDVLMHNHVLEHLPCDVCPALLNLNRLLAPGGVHLFSTPIMPNAWSVADLDPSLTPEQRRARFGQEDHVRLFGDQDFMDLLEQANMTGGLIDLRPIISEDELKDAEIPAHVFDTPNSHRVFVWRQPSD